MQNWNSLHLNEHYYLAYVIDFLDTPVIHRDKNKYNRHHLSSVQPHKKNRAVIIIPRWDFSLRIFFRFFFYSPERNGRAWHGDMCHLPGKWRPWNFLVASNQNPCAGERACAVAEGQENEGLRQPGEKQNKTKHTHASKSRRERKKGEEQRHKMVLLRTTKYVKKVKSRARRRWTTSEGTMNEKTQRKVRPKYIHIHIWEKGVPS